MSSPVMTHGDLIYFAELTQNDDFKKNVCIPYFKDIYKVSDMALHAGSEQPQ